MHLPKIPLHKIYVIFAYKLHQICVNCVIRNRSEILNSLKPNSQKDHSTKPLDGHLCTSTNDECKKRLGITNIPHISRIRLKWNTCMHKMYVVVVWHGLMQLCGMAELLQALHIYLFLNCSLLGHIHLHQPRSLLCCVFYSMSWISFVRTICLYMLHAEGIRINLS